jgi:hypothetical protein
MTKMIVFKKSHTIRRRNLIMDLSTKKGILSGINILIAISFSSLFLSLVTNGDAKDLVVFLGSMNVIVWSFAYSYQSRVASGLVVLVSTFGIISTSSTMQGTVTSFTDIMFFVNYLSLVFIFIACLKYHTITTSEEQ